MTPETPVETSPETASLPRLLVADDDAIGRTLVARQLTGRGWEVTTASDGTEAWSVLSADDAPSIAILDWMMPGLSGVELCRRLREREGAPPVYVVMLTSRDSQTDLLEALDSGADDYVTKPFDTAELEARVRVGARVVRLQKRLRRRVEELEATLARVRELQRLLPICSYCKQVRDDQDYWQSLDQYMARHGDVRFSHGICPDCADEHFPDVDEDPAAAD